MRMRKSVKGKTIQTGAVILLYALLLSAAFAGCILLFSRFAMHTAVDGATRLIVLPEDALGVIGSMGEVQFNVAETISMETYNRYFLQTMLLRLLPYAAGFFVLLRHRTFACGARMRYLRRLCLCRKHGGRRQQIHHISAAGALINIP